MDIKKLVEEYEILEDERDNRREFCEKFEEVVEKEFRPVAEKLVNMVKTFKELYPDSNSYSLPVDITRKIDILALCAGQLYDLLEGNNKKGNKIAKALGYNE